MANLIRAKEMLDALKKDFDDACKNPTRYCGDICLEVYYKKFNVSKEDVLDYCATLTPIVPVYPTCVICNKEWSGLDRIIQPISNGHVIDWVDSFSLFCCDESHHTIWYYQNSKNEVSIDMEVGELHGTEYQICWNCNYWDDEDRGKNVINEMIDINGSYDYKAVRYFDELPFTASDEEIYKLIKG